ncbi:MAG TPA: alpha/beta hydrolase fold domain-containing protein [Alphaproteobacteria bacterium]|nr:alpha/beta hydrolase fold domain-containing protein [Alphaproteobacteria bacterium]
MANRSGIKVVSVDYTPAPTARWREIMDQVVAVYRAVLAATGDANQIGIWGDSAGGSIVAGAALKLRDEGVPMPAAIVLWAPWSDVSMAGDTYTTLAAADPLLAIDRLKASANAYADPVDQKNPYVSPVYGDYSKGFPPTLIQCGTRDMFLSSCVREYQAISEAGMSATLDLYEGMVHVFQPMAPDSPEGRAAPGALTEIRIPPSNYPKGYATTVVNGAITSQPNASTLLVRTDPEAVQVEVRLARVGSLPPLPDLTKASSTAAPTARLSASSLLADLLRNPKARAIVERRLPQLANSPMIGMATQMSLRQLQPYLPSITNKDLAAIDAELARLKQRP